jgi:glycosyltransferase involved in cell wall biosynthesis
LRIFYLLNAYEEDGPGLLMERVASLMASYGDLEVVSAALSRGGALEGRFIERGIPTHLIAMKGIFDLPGYRALIRHIRNLRCDIVHTNVLRADIIGRMAAHAAGVPVIFSTEHGIHAWEERGKFWRPFVRRFYLHTVKYTKMIVAVSDFVKDSLIAEGVPQEKVVRIYNGVDTEVFIPLVRNEKDQYCKYLTERPVKNVIGLVGNLVEMKGLIYFIKAIPPILRQFPETLIIVIGEGALRHELEAEVARENLSDRVRFLGRISPLIPRLVGAMDILVQPSLIESFGLTVAEAMSCGVPVVASCVGGLSEIIEDGVCGYLVPPRDSDALAAKVIDLLSNPERCQMFGKAGRRRAVERFNIMSTVGQYYELYKTYAPRP